MKTINNVKCQKELSLMCLGNNVLGNTAMNTWVLNKKILFKDEFSLRALLPDEIPGLLKALYTLFPRRPVQ